MPRITREQMEKNREEITAASARLFRQFGLDGVSVTELMAAAGMSHGGFYNHFESKDDLAAVACARSFEQTLERWHDRIRLADSNATALAGIIASYLDNSRRDDPGPDCAAATLAADVARQPLDKPIRQTFAEGLDKSISALAKLFERPAPVARSEAITTFATMVGGIALARATRGSAISDEIVHAVRNALLSAVPASPVSEEPNTDGR